MTRALRIEYPGALYHIMSRGNAYQDIYLDDIDRYAFLKNLEHCIELHNLICHGYCLMNNHYHLLIETSESNLSKAMRDINGNYTQTFNTRHRRVGHVLQGRYKAFLVEKELYLLSLAKYIVNNPVRAKIVVHPRNWRWSSYRATGENIKSPKWLTTSYILSLFSKNKKEAQKQYRQHVNSIIDDISPFTNAVEGIILGSKQFIHSVWETSSGSENIKELPRQDRIIGKPKLEEIFEKLITKKERDSAIRFARVRCGYLITEIANHLELDRSTVGKICNKQSVNNKKDIC